MSKANGSEPIRNKSFWCRVPATVCICALALVVRSLTAYFVGTHLDDPGWFPFGIYDIFDTQARAILDGTSPAFWITEPGNVNALIYPPGYSLWLAVVYGVSGVHSAHAVQVVQVLLDSASVLLVVVVGEALFSRRAGLAAGVLAALSPLLALYGAAPLADAPTSWFVLGGILILIRGIKNDSVWQIAAAGALTGASCWFRSNGLFLSLFLAGAVFVCMRAALSRRLLLSLALILVTGTVVAPIIIRNSIAFQTFVPTGLGSGTNLWEGIGETDRADEFGAVYGDRLLLEKERSEMGRAGDESVGLYFPDGVKRDRERAAKAMTVITAHPVWYAGVMVLRMWGLLNFAGEDSGYYGSTGINVTSVKCLPPSWRSFPLNTIVTLIGYVQSVLRFLLLPLMALGCWYAIRKHPRLSLPLLSLVVYYLVVGTSLHSEIRYSLPMQAGLMVFAGVGATWLIDKLRSRAFGIYESGE